MEHPDESESKLAAHGGSGDVDVTGQGDAGANGEGEDEAWDEEDPELDALKRKVKQMQEEAEALDKIQQQVEQSIPGAIRKPMSAAEAAAAKNDKDARSVYVGQVDYGATPEELQAHFASCGTIDRITILCDKWTGKPKGYAYVMFVKPESVANALLLNETTFRGRQLKITPKRTNMPGVGGAGAPVPYAGGRGGRGQMAAAYAMAMPMAMPYYGAPVPGAFRGMPPAGAYGPAGRGRGGRGRGRGYYSPY